MLYSRKTHLQNLAGIVFQTQYWLSISIYPAFPSCESKVEHNMNMNNIGKKTLSVPSLYELAVLNLCRDIPTMVMVTRNKIPVDIALRGLKHTCVGFLEIKSRNTGKQITKAHNKDSNLNKFGVKL